MTSNENLGEITYKSLYHLKVGERERLRVASKSEDGRARVAELITEFLNDLPPSDDSALERAFILGREMKSVWPAVTFDEVSGRINGGVSPPLWQFFSRGFRSTETSKRPIGPPSLYKLNQVIKSIEENGVALASESARLLISQHVAYTERTGYSDLLARSAVRLCNLLLRRPQNERFQGGALAQVFLRDALKWEPWNERLWTLWSESYLAQGGLDPAELILWEGIRRFPNNPVFVAKLLRLLNSQRDRLLEGFEIAKAGLQRFPRDAYLPNAAAVNLFRMGRSDDATDLMVSAIRQGRNSTSNIGMLGTAIAASLDDSTSSFDAITRRLSALPNDPILFGKIIHELVKRGIEYENLVRFYRYTLSRFPGNVFLRNGLASRLARSNSFDEQQEGKAMFAAVLAEVPDNDFAQERLREIGGGEISSPEVGQESREEDPAVEESVVEDLAVEDIDVEVSGNQGGRFEDWTLSAEPVWPKLPAMVERLGRARRLRAHLESANDNIRDVALEELKEFIREDPTFAYAQLLAVRQGVWSSTSRVATAFAAAFEEALRIRDIGALRGLGDRAPRLSTLALGARAIFGDTSAVAAIRSLADSGQNRTELENRVVEVVMGAAGTEFKPQAAEATIANAVARLQELNEWALSEAFDLAA